MTTDRTKYLWQQSTLAVLLASVAGSAFALSYDAQTHLAIASGINPQLAGLYPLGTDAAVILTTLIAAWSHVDGRGRRFAMWTALGYWTFTSVLGNAVQVSVLPSEAVIVATPVAVAVHLVPALSLFIAIHLATTMAFRPAAPKPTVRASRKHPSTPTPAAPSPRTRTSSVSDRELLALSESGLGVRAIGQQLGLSKTTVADRLRDINTNRPDVGSDQIAS